MRHMSMPLEASHMAPVTLKEWPVKRGAPDLACKAKPKSCAMAMMVRTVSFLVAALPVEVGHSGDEEEEDKVEA